jgi:N-acetylneuraminic acid mutarotase
MRIFIPLIIIAYFIFWGCTGINDPYEHYPQVDSLSTYQGRPNDYIYIYGKNFINKEDYQIYFGDEIAQIVSIDNHIYIYKRMLTKRMLVVIPECYKTGSIEISIKFKNEVIARKNFLILDHFLKRGEMPFSGYNMHVKNCNNKIYIVGGTYESGEKSGKLFAEYDYENYEFIIKNDLPKAIEYFAACILNNKLYILGGEEYFSYSSINTVQIYNPLSDTWTSAASMLNRRSRFSAAVVNDKIYAICGRINYSHGNFDNLNNIEEYDPSTNQWILKADSPDSYNYHYSASIGNNIYLFGIQQQPVVTYDPIINIWETKISIPPQRADNSYTIYNNKIYVFGGSNVSVYDTNSDTWNQKANLAYTAARMGAVTIGNRIFIFGGFLGSEISNFSYSADIFEYLPYGD